jgi:tetratricopeptide (TPR) repeat protein
MNLGIVAFLAWRFEDAEVEFRRVIEKDPNFVRAYAFLACSLSYMDRHDEAISVARTGVERSNRHVMLLFALGIVTALAGKINEAREIFTPILPELTPFYAATVFAMLQEDSAALDTLEKSPEARSDWMYSVGRQPWFRQYHSDPRFVKLLEGLSLPGQS